MKEILQDSLGFKIPIRIYESVEEADSAAGKAGAVLEEANKNLIFRGVLPEGRALIAEAVESLTGIVREVVPIMKDVKDPKTNEVSSVQATTKDDEGNEVPATKYKLSEADYVDAAIAEWLQGDATRKKEGLEGDIQAFVRASNNGAGLAVDIKRAERKPPGPKTLAKKYIEKGQEIITGGKVAGFIKLYQSVFSKDPDLLGKDGNPDASKIGWELKALLAERERQSMAGI